MAKSHPVLAKLVRLSVLFNEVLSKQAITGLNPVSRSKITSFLVFDNLILSQYFQMVTTFVEFIFKTAKLLCRTFLSSANSIQN
jgi:hypothetical protein